MPSEPCSFTDYEEGIVFDEDDPDFGAGTGRNKENFRYFVGVPSPAMSLTSLEANNRSHSFSSISSLDEPRHTAEPTVLSIEELRHHLNSCFTCGVSWHQDHVSLDCPECGGYSLQRPCVQCDGKCHTVWKRDLTMSHASGKARWLGECAFISGNNKTESERMLKPISTEKDTKIFNRRNM
ncbi:protein pinocchio isoform X2 [Planococcus citri]|uniref:protein pinocchio isoform X2 n=1 Tax=Planococcus citri TaxID=170843 RepID=UPI0031F8C082